MADSVEGSFFSMASSGTLDNQPLSRRSFLTGAFFGASSLALYAGGFERHWIEIVRKDIYIGGLPDGLEGITIAQLSDIHLDEFTEPFLLREAVDQINQLRPEVVLLTGDYVSSEVLPRKQTIEAAWQCGRLLSHLECPHRYAIFGNHDIWAGEEHVGEALRSNGITVLRNASLPIERNGGRLWLAGIDDPVCGRPNLEQTIPAPIRNLPREPVVLMCHAPDFVDYLRTHSAGQSASLVLSGHTHGGQVRLPFVGPLHLPPGGRRYIEGLFQFGSMQLYVNRGIGSVTLPIRFNCRPEITFFTLRQGPCPTSMPV
jgi:predicted MPP superfamily phosphohydrolase